MTDTIKTDIEVALSAKDIPAINAGIEKLLAMVEKLPTSVEVGNKKFASLLEQIKLLQAELKKPTSDFNNIFGPLKAVEASLKNIKTLGKLTEFFSNKDVENILKASAATKELAKAFTDSQRSVAISKGVFGLDAKSISEVTSATKILKVELDAVRQQMSMEGWTGRNTTKPVVQQYRQILGNLAELETLKGRFEVSAAAVRAQSGINVATDAKASYARTSTGFQAYTNQGSYRLAQDAQWAIPGFVQSKVDHQAVVNARTLLGTTKALESTVGNLYTIGLAIGKTERELTLSRANQAQGLAHNTAALEKQLTLLKQQRQEILQSEKPAKADLEATRANAMLARVRGQGGAALMAVQASLIANYAVIQTALNGIRGSITTSVELEAAFRNVQAVTATTNAEMRGLEERIKSIAASTKFSAIEVAGAALILGQAGMSAKRTAEALPSVVALATAAGTTLAQAVDLVTSVVGVFDKSVSDTADIANKITQAANTSKISVEKLALGLQYAGNIASQSGVNFEETTAALSVMANAGIKSGSTMGTGLRQFLVEVQKPSQKFLEILQGMGLSMSDLDFRAKGLVGVMKTLHEAGFVASEAIQSFDIRGAAAFNAMVANPEALARQYEGLLNTQAAVEANAIQMDSLQAQTKRLTTSMGNLASDGLGPISRMLKGLAGGMATVLEKFREWPGVVTATTTAITGLLAVGLVAHYGSMIKVGLGMVELQGFLSAAWVSQIAIVKAVAVAYAGASASMGTMAGVIAGISAALGALKAVMLAHPITAFVALLSTVGGYLFLTESAAEKAAKKLDDLKASVQESKSAFEEKEQAVKSLTQKIEDLRYKEVSLSGDSKALKTVAMELNNQFGSLGLNIDLNNDSFGMMIEKLTAVKREMQEIMGLKLGSQLSSLALMAGEQTTQLTEQLRQMRAYAGVGGSAPQRIAELVKQSKMMDGPDISNDQRTSVNRALTSLGSSTDPKALASAEGGLSLILANLSRVSDPTVKRTLEKLVKDVQAGVVNSAGKLLETNFAIGAKQNEKSLLEARTEFSAKKQFAIPGTRGGLGTFDEVLPTAGGIAEQVLKQHPEVKKGSVEALKLIHEAFLQKNAVVSDIISKLEEDSSEVAKENIVKAKNRAQELQTKYLESYNASKAQLKATQGIEIERAKQRFGKDKAGAARAIADINRDYSLKETILDSGKIEVQIEWDRAKRETEAQNRERKAAEEQARNQFYAEKNSLRQQAENAISSAKGLQRRASYASSLDEVDQMMDEGVAKLIEAKNFRLKETVRKQEENPAVGEVMTEAYASSLRAIREDGDTAIRNYITEYEAIFSTVAKRLHKLAGGLDLNEGEAALKLLQDSGADKVYAAGAAARDMKAQVEAGLRDASDVELKQAILSESRTKVTVLVEQLAMLGDDTTGFIGLLTKEVTNAQEKLRAAKAGLNETPDLTPEGIIRQQSKIIIAQQELKDASDALHRNKKILTGTRSDLTKAEFAVKTEERSIPQEATWERMLQKMREAMGMYKQYVVGLDPLKTIGDGLLESFKGATGAVSGFFSNIASGSMTASQAFRQMASSIIRSMMDVFAQALAMQAVKGILGMFGLNNAVTQSGGAIGAADWFPLVPKAAGGPIRGGIPGKDSVGILATPGEFMLKKQAVDALGLDFLTHLNNTTNSTLAQSSGPTNLGQPRQPDTTNVWVVAPEAKPTMGPRDVVVAITDDMMRGGPTRQLVKQIQAGA